MFPVEMDPPWLVQSLLTEWKREENKQRVETLFSYLLMDVIKRYLNYLIILKILFNIDAHMTQKICINILLIYLF